MGSWELRTFEVLGSYLWPWPPENVEALAHPDDIPDLQVPEAGVQGHVLWTLLTAVVLLDVENVGSVGR